MTKTLVQRLWSNVTELKSLLECTNPHVPVIACKAVLSEMELKVKRLRLREIEARR